MATRVCFSCVHAASPALPLSPLRSSSSSSPRSSTRMSSKLRRNLSTSSLRFSAPPRNSTPQAASIPSTGHSELAACDPPVESSSVGGQGSATSAVPPSVNWHLEERCNYGCTFCFATFEDNKGLPVLSAAEALRRVPHLLADADVDKMTFVGGEPLMHPLIETLIKEAHDAGMVTSVVTNGSLLDEARLERLRPYLDWIAFSIDASSDELHARMGRGLKSDLVKGTSKHLARARHTWHVAKSLGYRLKLNTVVSKTNADDNMIDLVLELKPERWKVFQVLPIDGQNCNRVEDFLITADEFKSWVARHKCVEGQGIQLVPEDNDAMLQTYAMLDARCRFYTNTSGRYEYSSGSIFQMGVQAAWASLGSDAFSGEKFVGRGGLYDYYGEGQEALNKQGRWLEAAGLSLDATPCG